jgi:hypothetical protein
MINYSIDDTVVPIESITYRRKEVNRGIVIGYRKFMWECKRHKYPIYAKDKHGYINELLYKRREKIFYIPVTNLHWGQIITVYNRQDLYCRKPIEYVILEVNHVTVRLIKLPADKTEEKQSTRKRKSISDILETEERCIGT